MKVCIRKSTGKLIESQSGDADLNVMIQNAVNAGIPADDVEAKDATPDEYRALLGALKPPPLDESNLDNGQKHIKAAVLAAALLSGKTVPQAKTAFKQAWDALP